MYLELNCNPFQQIDKEEEAAQEKIVVVLAVFFLLAGGDDGHFAVKIGLGIAAKQGGGGGFKPLQSMTRLGSLQERKDY